MFLHNVIIVFMETAKYFFKFFYRDLNKKKNTFYKVYQAELEQCSV